MIIRVVKMEFDFGKVEAFRKLFDEHKNKIRNFPGVLRLELLQDIERENVFFPSSWWESAEDLEKYRHSELFKSVWSQTKILFAVKPQAWSLNREEFLP